MERERRRVTAGSRRRALEGTCQFRKMTLRPVSRAIVFAIWPGSAPRRLCGLCAYRYIDNGVWVPLSALLCPLYSNRGHGSSVSSVAELIDHWICWWNACSSINRGPMCTMGGERERRGQGRRKREFELNCKTLLRWKWAAKIIERLMGFLEWRSEWQKFKGPLEFQKPNPCVYIYIYIDVKEENNVVEVWSFLTVYTARLKWLTVNFKLAIKDDSFSPLGVELVSDRVPRKEKSTTTRFTEICL